MEVNKKLKEIVRSTNPIAGLILDSLESASETMTKSTTIEALKEESIKQEIKMVFQASG
jgi:hypothetical protein